MRVDVAVIGGGSAGLAAAVTAAREGASVLLAEKGSMPGGNVTAAQVHTLCGLYLLRGSESEQPVYANPGFPREIAENLLARGDARGPVRMGRLDVLLHRPAAFAALALELLENSPDLHLHLNTQLGAIHRKSDGSVEAVVLRSGGKDFTVEVSALIDTTGDAEAAVCAGAEFEISPLDRLQRPAYIVGIAGIPGQAMSDNGRLAIAHAISSGVAEKRLPEAALGTCFRQCVADGDVWMTIDLSAPAFDPTSPDAASGELYEEASELGNTLISLLREKIQGFEHASLIHHPQRLGIRESRRIRGLYELTERDVLEGRRFPDEVAFSAWPIELRETAGGPRFRFPDEDRACSIPLRSLQSGSISNLYMAGRCLSATHEAQAALRVIGTSLATGEAAGKAVASHLSKAQAAGNTPSGCLS